MSVVTAPLFAHASTFPWASTLARASADEVFDGIRTSMESGGDGGGLLALVLVLAALAGLLLVWWTLDRAPSAPPKVGRPRSAEQMLKDATRTLGLSRRETAHLKRLAAEHGWSDPLLPLICPSLLEGLAEHTTGLHPGDDPNLRTFRRFHALTAIGRDRRDSAGPASPPA